MIRLSDQQWERIRKHFPEEHIADDRPGRKPEPTRRVLEAVLWILNTGAQWRMLPQSYPNYKTVHRRFQTWCTPVAGGANGGGWAGGWWYGGAPVYGYRHLYAYYPHYRHLRYRRY